ncbi:MAG: 3-deoxy-8-phosphooctulonate synthase [Spirochaetota bacterium]|nr:3-deoxy-8-phosphooctulonate synthase [Spirochaetota bacterium]
MIKWLEKIGIRDLTHIKERRFLLIAGPCVINDPSETENIAKALIEITDSLEIPFVFKASYDKANRTSIKSNRGVGIKTGLAVLHHIRETYKIPVISDVHSVEEIKLAERILDFIQIPAFLCRQTDLLITAAETKKIINVKKGQFLSPHDMKYIIEKINSTGNNKTLITERGTSFGYNNLVNDFRGIPIMSQFSPVIFDATHSVQTPGSENGRSGGNRKYIPSLTRAAIAAGASGLFIEVHPNPDTSQSDSSTIFPLSKLKLLLEEALEIYKLVGNFHKWEDSI